MIAKIQSLVRREGFQRYFKNTSWMMVEHFVKIISGLFVGIYVARYLGPESYGILSYSMAIIVILFGVSKLGMEPILIRELTSKSNSDNFAKLVGTAFTVLLVFGVLSYSLMVILLWQLESFEAFLYTSMIGFGIFFQSFAVIAYSFQAKLQAKYSSIAKTVALIISGVVKVILVLNEASLFSIVFAYAFDAVLLGLSLLIAHHRLKEPVFIGQFDRKLVKPFLKSGIPMALAAVSYALYARIDQLMIQNMLGAEPLGLYSAAVKLYEGWVMLPYLIIMSLLPALVRAKDNCEQEFEKKMSSLIAFVFWSNAAVFLFIYLNSEFIISLTFGQAFIDSANTLLILIFASLFTNMGTISARYLNVTKKEKKITYITFYALVINFTLNYFFIPLWGIEGAAYATLLTMFFAFYVYDLLDPDLRDLFFMKNKGILLTFAFRSRNENN